MSIQVYFSTHPVNILHFKGMQNINGSEVVLSGEPLINKKCEKTNKQTNKKTNTEPFFPNIS